MRHKDSLADMEDKMAKVLIASLGDGTKTESRGYEYKKTTYYRTDDSNGISCETPFVSAALKYMYEIDEIIFIGTVGSSWSLLYKYLYDKENTIIPGSNEIDKNYFRDLSNIYLNNIEGMKLSVSEMRKQLTKLKESMEGFCRDIIILEYGITPDEQTKNLETLNNLASSLNDDDRVYFDISHAFRSLPFYELLAINLAKSVFEKNITLEMVSYGMYEISEQNKDRTPIVDMTQLVEMLEWTRAVDDYRSKGSFDLLLNLLEGDSFGANIRNLMSDQAVDAFIKLLKIISSNNYNDIESIFDLYKTIINDPSIKQNHPLLSIVKQIATQIFEYFKQFENDQIALVLRLVQWKIEKKQIVLAALLLVNAIENIGLDVLDIELCNRTERGKVHRKLNNAKSEDEYTKQFLEQYKEINDRRNGIAHIDPEEIDDISSYIEKETKYILCSYQKHYMKGKDKRAILKDALNNKK